MTNLALVTAGSLHVVESNKQMTLPFAEAVAIGQAVRLDTTTGKWTLAKATATGEARVWGVLVSKDGAGAAGTAVRDGVLDGFALSALDYDAIVYLSDTDGTLADAAGTVTTAIIGRVIPATATTTGTAYDKLLQVEILV